MENQSSILIYLSTIGSFLSLFSVLDLILHRQTKQSISLYMFGYEKINFLTFATRIISSLFGLFEHNGRIRKRRLYLGSLFIYFVLTSRVNFEALSELGFSHMSMVLVFPLVLLVGASISFPFDLAQIKIGKRIFKDISLTPSALFIKLGLYLFFSLIVVAPLFLFLGLLLAFGITYQVGIEIMEPICSRYDSLEQARDNYQEWKNQDVLDIGCYMHFSEELDADAKLKASVNKIVLLFNSSFASVVSVILLSGMIFIAIILGLFLNKATILFKWLNKLSMNTNAHNFPFTILGIITVILFEAIRIAST